MPVGEELKCKLPQLGCRVRDDRKENQSPRWKIMNFLIQLPTELKSGTEYREKERQTDNHIVARVK